MHCSTSDPQPHLSTRAHGHANKLHAASETHWSKNLACSSRWGYSLEALRRMPLSSSSCRRPSLLASALSNKSCKHKEGESPLHGGQSYLHHHVEPKHMLGVMQ